MRLDEEMLASIDQWRSGQNDIPSRAEAIRRLIEGGLQASTGEQLFVSMRFNILTHALGSGGSGLTNAYLYAWDRSVYPLFSESAAWHKPFARFFRVTEQMIDELSEFLDRRWMAKDVLTFYELESHYKARRGSSNWDRIGLVGACRYMYLESMFDANFWKRMLAPMEHPSEASHLTSKFRREDDISLM